MVIIGAPDADLEFLSTNYKGGMAREVSYLVKKDVVLE